MNKNELVSFVAKKVDMTKKDADVAVSAVFDCITEALVKGENVQLVGFGNFEVRNRAARTAQNPRTGEKVSVPATKVPAFKPGKALKDSIQ